MTEPAPEPHPLDEFREEARTADIAEVRRDLERLAAEQAALLEAPGWLATAEEALRGLIGRERKAQMEMRIGLEGELDDLPLRRTAPLADLTLPELRAELRETRTMTLHLAGRLWTLGERRDVRAWTLGEEVAPLLYLMVLRSRLQTLNVRVAEQHLNP